jgi:hypothetical protein
VPEASVAVPPPLDPPAPLVTAHDRVQAARDLAVRTAAAEPEAAEPAATPHDPAVRRAAEPEAAAGDPADWAAVRKALRALGVSRYGVEGEPAGKVRFHCVIPLAGRRAVGQHFEADGDDDLQAARAALRRIALWRATEAPAPPP